MSTIRAFASGCRAVALVVALGGCGSSDPGPRIVEPQSGASSGYFPLRLREPGLLPSDVVAVTVGGITTFGLAPAEDDSFVVMVQGHPSGGLVDIEITTVNGSVILPQAFFYEPPPHERFSSVVAIGASLTQGVQNGVPTQWGGLMSPAAQLARQLGGYFPLPLLVESFLPEMTPLDIGPPPACAPPEVAAFVASSAIEVLPLVAQGYDKARVDPHIDIHNLAVGGSRIGTVLRGPDPDDFGANFVARLVLDPFAKGPVEISQLDLLDQRQPTIVVSTDLFGNDVAAPLLASRIIDPTTITPIESFQADLVALLGRVVPSGAHVFLANMPQPSLLPLTSEKRARMIEQAIEEARETGGDEEAAAAEAAATADDAIAFTDEQALAFNEILATEAAAYDTVHVVDIAGRVAELATMGIEIGGERLTGQKFGGLLSLDGVHFTDTGYALLANEMVKAINDELGTAVPEIDVTLVHARDRGSPSSIAAAGLDVSQCDR
jgi:lysophospholipase L1-like esterase